MLFWQSKAASNSRNHSSNTYFRIVRRNVTMMSALLFELFPVMQMPKIAEELYP